MKASSSIDSAVATIIIGSVMLISSFITPIFVDRTGRRALLMISGAGMAFSCIVLGVYFFFNESGIVEDLGWPPVVLLVSFMVFYGGGFGILPTTVLSEMFSPETKPISISITMAVVWTLDFVVLKTFLPMENAIGNYGNFWLFGGISFLAMIFSWLFVFETKGLSLSEIQDILNGHRKSEIRK